MVVPSGEGGMPEPVDEARRREILAMLAPGTTMRDGIERILRAGRGALIVFGSTPQALSLCSGGFVMDSHATGQRIAELAKMDGALVVDAEAGRILRANVQLVPDPDIPTEETGTRHRSAERTAKQTGLPVVAVSESLGAVSLYLDGMRYVVDEVATVMYRANQAMSTLERYRARFDEVIELLATRELEDHVTLRDVALALQRAEMLRRIADKLDGHVIELGEEGRMIALQLEELFEPVEPVLELIVRDYLADRRRRPARCVAELARADDGRAARPRTRRPPARGGRFGPRPQGHAAGLPDARSDPEAPDGRRGAPHRSLRRAPPDPRGHHERARGRRGRRSDACACHPRMAAAPAGAAAARHLSPARRRDRKSPWMGATAPRIGFCRS
jgi:DNA integrity scanning protein DisA with diadenylate cyclase activity